ncbi:MAG: glucose-6-phosphate dehydrogenase [Parachlamydia sp.]|nr:MAG: glucose-6-phosphate dehydrogenase [Parachlamydia sp.]
MKKLLTLILLVLPLLCFSDSTSTRPPVTIVIFGSTGDLTARKLYPAIYNLALEEKELNENFSLVGVGRRNLSAEELHDSVYASLDKFSRLKPSDKSWNLFKQHLVYHKADFSLESDYLGLKELLAQQDQKAGRPGNTIFYLATDSSYFPTIIHNLYKHGLVDQNGGSKFSRVIIEKPFGEDLDSAIELQAFISQFLDEEQIFRMDHYLGKEGMLTLMKFRFQDAKFESLFDQKYVSNIQMTLSETIGISTRANFYEKTGHLRDVVQNHAMQLLAIATMEPPLGLKAEEILKEKAKVLYAIRPYSSEEIAQYVIRGQYSSGIIEGKPVIGYRDENGVPKTSQIETFVQAKMFIDNERWSGVPIYIKSGKRLPQQTTQVTFNLKDNPFQIDAITIAIQPKSQILITRGEITEAYEIQASPCFAGREAYENLILATVQGDQSHFVTMDEVLSTWSLLTPVLKHWSTTPENVLLYEAGQWGPEAAEQQLQQDGFEWKVLNSKNK